MIRKLIMAMMKLGGQKIIATRVMRQDLSITTDDFIEKFDNSTTVNTPTNLRTPSRLSNYSFKHYLARRSSEGACMHHSLDNKPLDPPRPKFRKSVVDFAKQFRPPTVVRDRSDSFPGMYTFERIRRHVSTPDFSRQIDREKANFRARKISFEIEDRSLARDCPIIGARRRVTVFYPIKPTT